MEVIHSHLKGVLTIVPHVFGDDRGYFMESFNCERWKKEIGEVPTFVQDNESKSQKGVLRGLHFQRPPFSQGKLLRVIHGSALDVAVDLRKNSSTFGQHEKIILSSKNKKQFYIPEGFAHGFLALEENTIFAYKCTNYYRKDSESGLMWNDKKLEIDWGIQAPILSEKDKDYVPFSSFESPF